MGREEEKMAARDMIHKEVDRLGEFANRVRECHGDAVEALARLDHAKSGAEELITMFIAAGSINAVREECEKFNEYFERHAEEEAPRINSEFYRLAVSATSDHTKSVIDGFRKAFLDTEEGEK